MANSIEKQNVYKMFAQLKQINSFSALSCFFAFILIYQPTKSIFRMKKLLKSWRWGVELGE